MKNSYKVGDKIKFAGEKQSFTVRACNERYAVCTKPFNLLKTVLYTVIDFVDEIRGPNNLVFNMYDYKTTEGCQSYLDDLMMPEDHPAYHRHQISFRHRVALKIESK